MANNGWLIVHHRSTIQQQKVRAGRIFDAANEYFQGSGLHTVMSELLHSVE